MGDGGRDAEEKGGECEADYAVDEMGGVRAARPGGHLQMAAMKAWLATAAA